MLRTKQEIKQEVDRLRKKIKQEVDRLRKKIKQEVDRLRKKAEEIEYFVTTLTYEHQQSTIVELKRKSIELRELQKEYEGLLINLQKEVD